VSDAITLAEAIAALGEANAALTERLAESRALMDRAEEMFAAGTSVPEALGQLPVRAHEEATDGAIRALLTTRSRLKRVLARDAVDAGMPIEEIASVLEARPDLIATYLAEQTPRS
jgi:hypothetical protein